jgi:hypothetical protein
MTARVTRVSIVPLACDADASRLRTRSLPHVLIERPPWQSAAQDGRDSPADAFGVSRRAGRSSPRRP